MIHAFNFTGSRDLELSNLMVKGLRKYCKDLGHVSVTNTDGTLYGNGGGWEASMLKVKELKNLVARGINDDDWVLSVDSDVVFCNTKIFDWLNVLTLMRYNYYGIVGIMQNEGRPKTEIGELKNMSGCSIYLRGAIAKKIAALSSETLESVREQFKAWVICENEDIVISYLAQMVGAHPLPIPDHMYHGSFEEDITTGKEMRCFYHLNYCPTEFLGQKISGKWDIPAVLNNKGIEL